MKPYEPAKVESVSGIVKVVKRFMRDHPGPHTIHNAVVYVQANLPQGVDRVDGDLIAPILDDLQKEPLSVDVLTLKPKTVWDRIKGVFK